MSRAIDEALVRNLKLFNAKERDHLMRFAYLGGDAAYPDASTFLSPRFDAVLREEHVRPMGLGPEAKCVFAGMDYHLDWLFAALWLARTSPAGTPEDGVRVPMDAHEGVAGIKSLYTDFRPLNGSQEDIDLVAVFDDGQRLAVLLIEAKGSAAFDKVQLARKVIRLDRILVDSGMSAADSRAIQFRFILAAPNKPRFEDCRAYARTLPPPRPGDIDKFKAMREALEVHPSGIGDCMHFLRIPGFPETTYAVERLPEAGVFRHWALRKRAWRKRA